MVLVREQCCLWGRQYPLRFWLWQRGKEEKDKWRKDGEELVFNRHQEQMWKPADDLGCTLLPIWAGEELNLNSPSFRPGPEHSSFFYFVLVLNLILPDKWCHASFTCEETGLSDQEKPSQGPHSWHMEELDLSPALLHTTIQLAVHLGALA